MEVQPNDHRPLLVSFYAIKGALSFWNKWT